MVFLVATPVAQEKGSIPDEIAELAAQLDRAHRGGNTDRLIHSFSAQLVLETVAAGDNALSIDLDAEFLAYSNNETTRHYIKYRVQEEGQLIERGRSPDGFWAQIDDKVVYLTAARHRQDREKVQQEIRLALQLLQFLDPGRVLRSLRGDVEVRTETLKPGRRPISCKVVEGFVDSFPLYYLGGQTGRVFLKLWVDEAEGHLVAVQATPMTEEGHRDPLHGEFILMSEHQKDPNGTVLLPTQLKIYKVDAEGSRNLQITVRLQRFDLDPGLEPDDFRKY